MKKSVKISAIVLTVLAFIVAALLAVAFIPRMKAKDSDYRTAYYKYQYIDSTLQPAAIKAKLDDLIGIHNYTLVEKTNLAVRGKTYMFLVWNVVQVQEDLDIEDFTRTLAHELMHIKLFSADERYVEFHTFKLLYESNDPDLKKIAINIANENLDYAVHPSYDCGYYIQEYLKEVGEWDDLLKTHKPPYMII